MSRTFIRQDAQIAHSVVYDDAVAPGTTLESATASLEDDLNGLRSQLKRLIWDDGAGNWYDDVPTVNAKKRGVFDLNSDLNDLEEKKFLCRANVLTDVSVTAAQNWEILSVAGNEAPTQVAAVALTRNGAVVAQSALNGSGFNAHELTELTGTDALHPKNLAIVRDGSTGQVLQSEGRDVFALLQYESTGVDGAAFNDTSAGGRVKLSFVRANAAFDDLEACPVADVAGKNINYNYVFRVNFDAFTEASFLSLNGFVDQSSAVDVTLQRAYANQGTTPVELANNSDTDLATSVQWAIRDAANADLINFTEGSAGGTTSLTIGSDVDSYQNNAIDVDFNNGITVRETGTRPIDIGKNDGVLETTAGDLRVFAAGELLLDDGNQTGSTWAQTGGIKLTETTAEWDAFEAAFGEVSLLSAILASYNAVAARTKVVAVLTADVAADTNVSGPSGDNNLDVNLPDMSSGSFVLAHDIYLNGVLLRNGADASTNNDVYPGTSLAAGQLKFEFALRASGAHPDVLTIINWA